MVEAVIFDLDGTILDNEGEWEQAVVNTGIKHGLKMSGQKVEIEGGWVHEPGAGLYSNWRRILEVNKKFQEELARKLTVETVVEYNQLNPQPRMREGIEEVMELVKGRGWLTALCTGSNWNVAEKALENIGMTLAFNITTTGEEVYMPKPDPEIFLLTAQKLEVDPRNCLVIEDAIAGVRAAKEVEMQVVALQSDYATLKLLKAVQANHIVKDINEVKEIISQIKDEKIEEKGSEE